jgi:putative ABC transport system ATP-binding protein
MLKLENISVSFGSLNVLKDLSCHVQNGDFIVVVGANGAGKSTFFDVIAGKTKPTKGKIELEGVDITQTTEIERANLVTRLFQNTHLNSVGSMTVAQNLALALYSRKKASLVNGMQDMPIQKARELLKPLNINAESYVDKPMNSLSGGQRQLIAFVMSTLHIPQILLLDEPTAALDPQAATKLLQFASSFIKQHKITTLMITHDPHIALSMGNKVWILEDGKITKQYNEVDKKSLHPDKLIGQIDYATLY